MKNWVKSLVFAITIIFGYLTIAWIVNAQVVVTPILRLFVAGTIGAPGMAFGTDPTSGHYSARTGTLGISTGGVEFGEFSVAKVSMTAAQVQTLQTTPVTIVSPPAGTVAIFLGAKLMLNADGTADFAGVGAGEDLVFQYETSSDVVSATCDTATCINLDAASADSGYVMPLATGFTTTANVAKDIQISEDGGGNGFTGGANDDLEVHVYYRLVTQNN